MTSMENSRSSSEKQKRKFFGSKFLVLFIALTALGVLEFGPFGRLFPSPLEKEYNLLIAHSVETRSPIDFKNIKSVDWNQIWIVTPYSSTLDPSVSGYSGPTIESSDDDEMYILFLKEMNYQGYVGVDRRLIDFSSCQSRKCLIDFNTSGPDISGPGAPEPHCGCKNLFSKDEAVFEVEHSKDSFRRVYHK